MLISQKIAQDKIVTDFRHLNVRTAKNNLVYPLVRDTFSVLDNSKCEVLSVLDLKEAFHSLRLLGRFEEDIVAYYHILEVHHVYTSENAKGMKYFTFNLAVIHKSNLRMFTK